MVDAIGGAVSHILSDPWFLVGFAGQFLFMMRFVVQWVHSERERRSIVPVAFWFFSVGGGAVLLAYAIYRRDPVFIAGQALGMLIYARNLYLIYAAPRSQPRESDLTRARRLVDELTLGIKGGGDVREGQIERALAELQILLSKIKT